jgi:hypothetical protein
LKGGISMMVGSIPDPMGADADAWFTDPGPISIRNCKSVLSGASTVETKGLRMDMPE